MRNKIYLQPVANGVINCDMFHPGCSFSLSDPTDIRAERENDMAGVSGFINRSVLEPDFGSYPKELRRSFNR